MSRQSFWGWGHEGAGPDQAARERLAKSLGERFGRADLAPAPLPRIEEIALRPPRVAPPSALAGIAGSDPWQRARHTYGRSYRDAVRVQRRDFSHPPDWVAFPRSEQDVAAVLEHCTRERIALIPFGGGSSVVGGVEANVAGDYRGVVTLDLGGMSRVLELDRSSRAARIEAGVLGPALEDQLRPHGLTLRHFPQSFEFSSLGGWIATRSGGHFATRYTHIDDFVEALRVVTPTGVIATRRLPGSGAGPSPDRAFIGSEGTLGVITEAWMRLQDRPTRRASASVRFPGFEAGVRAVRALSQSGLEPANCRLLDPGEAASSAGAAGGEAILVLGFESADHDLDAWMRRAVELCRDHGGLVPDDAMRTRGDASAAREGSTGAWRSSFIGAPYLRDALVSIGVLAETFETAITWDRFERLHQRVMAEVKDALVRVYGAGTITCRFTHVYPDGPAPYYSLLAPARRGSELEQWDEVKRVASEILAAEGATITHHHAVGRDHRPWYDRQRPEGFARALRAAKAALDPAWVLNPGVLFDREQPQRSEP
ncbi:MAG TPA: FAD-binding oxidoreductase [Myxococcota bacterium]|nr:FAD-binding oxidoreductase [Myxococcota bacterium]